jgi:hypothetical protein
MRFILEVVNEQILEGLRQENVEVPPGFSAEMAGDHPISPEALERAAEEVGDLAVDVTPAAPGKRGRCTCRCPSPVATRPPTP